VNIILKELLWDSCAISDDPDLNNSYGIIKSHSETSSFKHSLLGSDIGISAVSGFHLNFIPEASHKY
jgi:hypothetical protein